MAHSTNSYIFDITFLNEKVIIPLEDELKKQGEKISKRQLAWDTLTKMEDKWKVYTDALDKKEVNEIYKTRAESILKYFEKSSDSVLEKIYDDIKSNFDEYYTEIHCEDEKGFSSKIEHKKAELVLEVDFYGRGMFPPHALHSEGHQDSMGLCLFFALNKYLTGDTIKVVILDDVVMSIDRNHRRSVCELLKKFFPDRQLIITMHETAWTKQLKTEGVVKQKNMVHFLNWNIDTGPIYELEKNLWKKIKDDLGKDDVPSAAHKLRRNAECFFEDVCDLLEAKVTYKGSHRWELGDFAPSAVSTYKKYLQKAKANAHRMKQEDKLNELKQIEDKATKIISKSQIEQWIVNESVHYNKWSDFSRNDFEPVVGIFKDLFGLFQCDECGATISFVEKRRDDTKKLVLCNCNKICWNIQ